MKLKKGFTLIELLVVIAIIAILATVIIINVTGARVKAAKAKVAADMSVAAKVIAACGSFGGTLIQPSFGMIPIQGETICNTNGMDPTEAGVATGKWPTMPADFAHTDESTTSAPVVIYKGVANATFSCSSSGCVKGAAWDSTTSSGDGSSAPVFAAGNISVSWEGAGSPDKYLIHFPEATTSSGSISKYEISGTFQDACDGTSNHALATITITTYPPAGYELMYGDGQQGGSCIESGSLSVKAYDSSGNTASRDSGFTVSPGWPWLQ